MQGEPAAVHVDAFDHDEGPVKGHKRDVFFLADEALARYGEVDR